MEAEERMVRSKPPEPNPPGKKTRLAAPHGLSPPPRGTTYTVSKRLTFPRQRPRWTCSARHPQVIDALGQSGLGSLEHRACLGA